MEFEVSKNDFAKTLQTVQSAISTKNTLPILSNLLIEALKDGINITATDLDVGITSSIKIKPKTEGSITIPAKKLLDIIKELPDGGTTTIALKKNNMIVIDCGKAHFKIIGLPKEEFPQLPEFKDKDFITIPQKLLKEMIVLTNFAVSKDETRYVLNGILCVIEDKTIKLVATDGRRLAVIEKEIPIKSAISKKMIIPTKTANELVKLLEDDGVVKVLFGESQVSFDLGATKIISRLIEGEFPNYEQVIPKEVKEKIRVKRQDLLSAAKRASLFTNQDSLAVKMDVSKNKMIVSKNAPYMGEVKEELGITYNGKTISVGFNPIYIIEPLKNIDAEEVEFEIEDTDKPGVMRIGSEYIYVVLPMQLT